MKVRSGLRCSKGILKLYPYQRKDLELLARSLEIWATTGDRLSGMKFTRYKFNQIIQCKYLGSDLLKAYEMVSLPIPKWVKEKYGNEVD